MEITETHADSLVRGETTTWCHHLDARWLVRVLFWEEERAVVKAALIGTVFEPEDNEVPGKLTYFDFGGRAEPIRMMLAHAGVEYEDHRIQVADWGPMKEAKFAEMGGLPVWTEDGVQICQSNAILRMLGMRHGYYTQDPLTAGRIDSLCDWIEDFCEQGYKYIFAQVGVMPPEKGEPEVILGYYDRKLPLIEARLAASGKPYVGGTDAPTIADFKVFH